MHEALEHFGIRHAVGRALLDLLPDLGQLVADVLVLGGQGAEVDEDLFGVVPAVLAGEPARRLGAHQHAHAEEGAGHELQAERDDPLRGAARGDGSVAGVVDLGCDESERSCRCSICDNAVAVSYPEAQHATSL